MKATKVGKVWEESPPIIKFLFATVVGFILGLWLGFTLKLEYFIIWILVFSAIWIVFRVVLIRISTRKNLDLEILFLSIVFVFLGYFLAGHIPEDSSAYVGLSSWAILFFVLGLTYIYWLHIDIKNKNYRPFSNIAGYIVGLIFVILSIMALAGSIATNSASLLSTSTIMMFIIIGIILLYQAYVYPEKP